MSILTTSLYYRGERGQVYVEPVREYMTDRFHAVAVSKRLKEIWQCEVTVANQVNVTLYRTNQDLAV